MAKVPLRTYLKEVESAIEEHQIDEAIAHCRHILEIYPKHIDTYKLLGKAYLEAQRYGNAVDIFQRILSSIPDDFVSHVGMSVIREDGSNLDAAFWHMERAFEVQPYNPAIRDELRRLYGKRDGVQPPKARLTPGALARLYAKGGHLQQAISELNATISEEPKRFDLLVLLASAYDKSGEQVQAVNTCTLILQDLPYCLEANRLLAKLLISGEHEEFRLGCEQRLQELDPYQLNFSTSAENVPAQTVMLERLDWDVRTPGDEEIPSKWASASEIDRQEPDSEESGLPDWLDKLSGGSDFSNDTHEPKEETEIPDWMVDAGWEQPKGDVEKSAAPLDLDNDQRGPSAGDTESAEAANEIPDWLADMAPDPPRNDDIEKIEKIESIFKDSDLSSPESELPEEAEKNIQSLPISSQDATGEDEQLAPSDDIPDWLAGIDVDQSSGEVAREDTAENWLQEMSSTPSSYPQQLKDSELADQISEVSDIHQEKDPEPAPAQEAFPDLEESAAGDDLPDWLADLEHGSSDREITADDSAINWLQNLGVSDSPESIVDESKPEAKTEELPEWLGETSSIVDQEIDAIDPDQADLLEIDQNNFSEDETSLKTPVDQSDVQMEDAPNWFIKTSDDEQETIPYSLPRSPDQKKKSITDWLQEIKEPNDIASDTESSEKTQIPDDADEFFPTDSIDLDKAVDASQDILQEDQETTAEDSKDMLSDEPSDSTAWLQSVQEQEKESVEDLLTTETPAKAEQITEDNVPEWLQNIASEEALLESTHQPDDTNIPEWLQNISDETSVETATPPAAAQPTATQENITEDDLPPTASDDDKPPVDLEDTNATMAWLESLAAKQGVPEDELVTSQEEREEALGTIIQDQAVTEDAAQVHEPIEEQLDKPSDFSEWLSKPTSQEPVITEEFGEMGVPEWLQDAPVPEVDPDIHQQVVSDDSQVKGDQSAAEPQPEEIEAQSEAAIKEDDPAIDEDLPEWIAEELSLESEQSDLVSDVPADVDETQTPAVEKESEISEVHDDQTYAWVPPERQETTTAIKSEEIDLDQAVPEDIASTQEEIEDPYHANQLEAQHHLSKGRIEKSMQHYEEMIRKNKRIDEVINDLDAARHQYPTNALVLQTLGDAYLRVDNLQKALHIYSKAEQLLLS